MRARAAGAGGADGPDGWQLAVRLTSSGFHGGDEAARAHAEELAAAAVVRRASALVGPLRGATQLVRGPLKEPGRGELDLEQTLENVVGKRRPEADDWIVQERVERRRQVVLMVDMSGSMAGQNMALAAVAGAVLALKLRPGDLGVVGFSDEARVIVRLGEQLDVHEVVRRLLDRPCHGGTNVDAALRSGYEELARGRDPRRAAVLVTDGLYTAGPDPRATAEKFSSLHVLHTDGTDGGKPQTVWITPRRQVGRDVAQLGGGILVPVTTFAELPRRMLDLADRVLG